MGKTRVQDYVEKFADHPIRFTPYALKKTGLVQSQVFLKIEDYLLICAPFQLSMKRGIFLVVLSAQEITFFQQFQKKLCSINLTFQKTGNKKPLSLLLRGTIERIGPVKGKQNVCMMDASLKACPNDLVEIIGDYITAFEGLKGQYDNFSGKAIQLDEAAAKLMRFNNYVELVIGTMKARASLISLAVNSLSLRLPAAPPGLAEGEPCSVRLYFQVYQFTANGKISALERGEGAQVIATMTIEFTPELIEIVDDYFFRQSIQGKGKATQPGA
ncbi:MAG: PilZN3 domain-containing protein [Spirochaetia bacterium]|jgi:hypothetical protein